jgi:hypothetical protein
VGNETRRCLLEWPKYAKEASKSGRCREDATRGGVCVVLLVVDGRLWLAVGGWWLVVGGDAATTGVEWPWA